MRWTGDQLDSRGTDEERRQRRGKRIVATIDALVDQLAVIRGAAMKAGQVLSTVEFPGLDDDAAAHLEARLGSLRDSILPSAGRRCARCWPATGRATGVLSRADRHGTGSRGQHRSGLSRADARRP